MFLAPPPSILMEPVVGGVTHDPINARHRLERARTAHRQKKEPKPLTPIGSPWFRVTIFFFLAKALKKNTVCPVVKKRSRQIAFCRFLFEQSYVQWASPKTRIPYDFSFYVGRTGHIPKNFRSAALSLPRHNHGDRRHFLLDVTTREDLANWCS
jgi:hypothetical protein